MNTVIDISEFQRGADLSEAVRDGIDGFVFRLGWGSDSTTQDDPSFEGFVAQAEALGRPWGAYIFSYAFADEQLESEIRHALRKLKGKKPKLPVYFDLENSYYKEKNGWSDLEHTETVRKWADRFIEAMEEAGYKGGLYCNLNYASQIGVNGIQHFWLACYGCGDNAEKPPMACEMWQYTSAGSIDGIVGNTDVNYYYGDALTDAGGEEDDRQQFYIDGGSKVMKKSREQLIYEIERLTMTTLGRAIPNADEYADLLINGTYDWYDVSSKFQECEEAIKHWIRTELFWNVLKREAQEEEVNWWYTQYAYYPKEVMSKEIMKKRFQENYEDFRLEYIEKMNELV